MNSANDRVFMQFFNNYIAASTYRLHKSLSALNFLATIYLHIIFIHNVLFTSNLHSQKITTVSAFIE